MSIRGDLCYLRSSSVAPGYVFCYYSYILFHKLARITNYRWSQDQPKTNYKYVIKSK